MTHSASDGTVHAGTRWDCQPCETARRMALYGPCEDCGTARDVRDVPDIMCGGTMLELYCPGCGQ